MHTWACLVVTATLLVGARSYIPVSSKMKSFSSVIKEGSIEANVEKVLYERNTGQPGVITEQWSAGYPQIQGPMQSGTRFRIYVDGEADPSLDYDVFLFHGIGLGGEQPADNPPWGTRRVGRTANGGGLYNTFRIPYSVSIRVTVTTPYSGLFWYIIRGVENYPLVLGDLQLPNNTRLRLYKNVNVSLQPYEFLILADPKSSAGALFLVTIVATNSEGAPQYLEACFRAVIDGEQTSFLSSGTEDMFLSAYYFDSGPFHLENSGVTVLSSDASTMSAYKYFENDPILFSESLLLLWRAGETPDGPEGCPSDFPPPGEGQRRRQSFRMPSPSGTTSVVTYALVYQW
ncbi:hypothetical protein EMCRGX_G002326 [Ephydatia muelleri]